MTANCPLCSQWSVTRNQMASVYLSLKCFSVFLPFSASKQIVALLKVSLVPIRPV